MLPRTPFTVWFWVRLCHERNLHEIRNAKWVAAMFMLWRPLQDHTTVAAHVHCCWLAGSPCWWRAIAWVVCAFSSSSQIVPSAFTNPMPGICDKCQLPCKPPVWPRLVALEDRCRFQSVLGVLVCHHKLQCFLKDSRLFSCIHFVFAPLHFISIFPSQLSSLKK